MNVIIMIWFNFLVLLTNFLQVLNENDHAPPGCGVAVVNESLTVYLQLQGLNPEGELEKLRKRKQEIQRSVLEDKDEGNHFLSTV